MCNKQDYFRLILSPKGENFLFQSSSLLEVVSNMRSLKEIDFGLPLKGRPKCDKGHSSIAQSNKEANLIVCACDMLLLEGVLFFSLILSLEKHSNANKISFTDCSSSRDVLEKKDGVVGDL